MNKSKITKFSTLVGYYILFMAFFSALAYFLASCSSTSETNRNQGLVKIIPGEQQIFWFDKPEDFALTPKLKDYLDLIINYVNEKDDEFKSRYIINLEGHSDDTGTKMENALRADLRVNSVIEYLTENGIPKKQIKFQTFGSTVPYSNPNTEEGKKLDRRVVVKFNLN